MRNIDRITEAYYGMLGKGLMEASRERINWICSQAKGEKILDVGCSQGISSIILAREGKKVCGVDICKESIDYANDARTKEDLSTQNNLQFHCTSFTDFISDSKINYDCVVMGELIEHLADPERFIKRALDVLEDGGHIIVTVPFGISDYHDHKRAYYTTALYNSVGRYFQIENFAFLGGWIGIVGTKISLSTPMLIDDDLFIRTEKAFFNHESKLLDKLDERRTESKTLQTDTKNLSMEIERLKELNEVLEQSLERSHKLNEDLASELVMYVKNAQKEIGLLEELKRYSNNQQAQIRSLRYKNEQYAQKISLITGTWYGRTMIWCYKSLRKLVRKIIRK